MSVFSRCIPVLQLLTESRLRGAISALLLLCGIVFPPCPAAAADLTYADLTETELQEAEAFVASNVWFIALHEFGHLLIFELNLPVVGQEEDAVDILATTLMLGMGSTAERPNWLTDAADGWFLTAETPDGQERAGLFWDEHGLDQQRAYQIAWLAYGHDPEFFKTYADSVELPVFRRERCAIEYQRASASWSALLAPHAAKDRSISTITVVHDDPPDELAASAGFLKSLRVFEELSTLYAPNWALKEGIILHATSCGVANAFWNPDARTLTFCYEQVEFFRELILDYFGRQRQAPASEGITVVAADKTPSPDAPPGGASEAAIFAIQCAGPATFENDCESGDLFVRLCLGSGDTAERKSFRLRPAGLNTRSVPQGSTYDARCGEPPPAGCPAEYPVQLQRCD